MLIPIRNVVLVLSLVHLPAALGETELEKATKAFSAGEFTQVLDVARAADAAAADWPKIQYLAGETALILGRDEEAERSFRNVLAKRPEAVPAQVGLGRALTDLGRTDEAAAVLSKALAAAPKDVGALTAHGMLLAAREELTQARKELEAARALAPEDTLATRALVEVLLRANDGPEAARIAEEFSKTRAQHPMGYFLLALVMERDGEDAGAIAQYEAALEKDPRFLDAHKNLAILCHTLSNTYRDKERTKKAYEHYARYFELGGEDATLRAMHEQLLSFKDQILGS
jgi:tetratricopeptide (TPR) repeat protein